MMSKTRWQRWDAQTRRRFVSAFTLLGLGFILWGVFASGPLVGVAAHPLKLPALIIGTLLTVFSLGVIKAID